MAQAETENNKHNNTVINIQNRLLIPIFAPPYYGEADAASGVLFHFHFIYAGSIQS